MSNCNRFYKNIISFGVVHSSFFHLNYKKKDILKLGKDPADGLNDTIIILEPEYSINVTEAKKHILSVSLLYCFLYVNNV